MSRLISIFVVLALLSLINLFYFQYLIFEEFSKLFKLMVYYNFCQKENNYFLEGRVDLEFCQKINKMKEMGEIDCKSLYENKEQLNACENLKQTFNQRIEECFDLILNKNVTSQNYSVGRDCQILLKSIK